MEPTTTAAPAAAWIVLIVTQPTGNAALRMRVWREVRSRGAAILRDGAYLLPARPELATAFAALAEAVAAAGGSAHVLHAAADEAQHAEWRALFDRGTEYAELLARIQKHEARVKQPVDAARAACHELEEAFAAIAATDHFGAAGREQVAQALADWRAQIERRAAPGEPRAQARSIERLRREEYQRRVWATRRGLWVDRVASAWLIRGFVDPAARFVWIARPDAKPKRAIGFDFDGAQFTHRSGRVTFEVLLASFGLDDDAALVRLGRVIHALDVGGLPVAEAAGIEAVLTGLRRRHGDDDAFLAAAVPLFDACHAAFADAAAKERR